MYQDKNEVERELEAAKKLLEESNAPISVASRQARVWNPMSYARYTHSSSDDE